MDEKRGRVFLAVAGALAFAFATGFCIELFRFKDSGILHKYAVSWELSAGALFLGLWAFPVLLASVTAVAEGDGVPTGGFVELARRELVPSLVVAVILSVFSVVAIPAIEGRMSFYRTTSAMFESALSEAERALRDGELDRAGEQLLVCRGIDPRDLRYDELDKRVRARALAESGNAAARAASEPGRPAEKSSKGKTANEYYLDALKSFDAKKYYEANYLAKKASAIDPKRQDIQMLVNQSWSKIKSLAEDETIKADAAFYRKKLEGYRSMQAGDFLAAYDAFRNLAADHPADPDVKSYLAESVEGVRRTAYFADEDRIAFGNSGGRALMMRMETPGGPVRLSAAAASATIDGFYLRGVEYRMTAPGSDTAIVSLKAPYAKLHGKNLYLRMVERNDPKSVWQPAFEAGMPENGIGSFLIVPFEENDAVTAFSLSGKPHDIAPLNLFYGLSKAGLYGVDPLPLRVEFADRLVSPFVTIILVLLGLSLGRRFRAREAPSRIGFALGVLVLALASAPTLAAAGHFTRILESFLVRSLDGSMFFLAWFGTLAGGTVLSLFAAIRISRHAA